MSLFGNRNLRDEWKKSYTRQVAQEAADKLNQYMKQQVNQRVNGGYSNEPRQNDTASNRGPSPEGVNNTTYHYSYRSAKKKEEPKQSAAPQQPANMKEIIKKSAAPFYAVGITWLLYAALLPMYRWFDFVIAAAVSLLVYWLAKKIFKDKKIYVPVPQEPVQTGNSEVDRIIAEGKEYLAQLRRADLDIPDAKISAQIVRMEDISSKIFAFIAENPNRAPEIRRFMNYYLPTTLKLLKSYHRLDSQGIRGENITATMRNIEKMMDTIVLAFEKQLDNLFQDEAMDISTDITVLEGMLEREGLTGDPMNK